MVSQVRETIEAIIICVWRVRPDLLVKYYQSLEQIFEYQKRDSKRRVSILGATPHTAKNGLFSAYLFQMKMMTLDILKDLLLVKLPKELFGQLDLYSTVYRIISNSRETKLIQGSYELANWIKKSNTEGDLGNNFLRLMSNISKAEYDCKEGSSSDNAARFSAVFQSTQVINKIAIAQTKSAKLKEMDQKTAIICIETIITEYSRGLSLDKIRDLDLLDIEQVLSTLHSFVFSPEKYEVYHMNTDPLFESPVKKYFSTYQNLRAVLTFSLLNDSRLSKIDSFQVDFSVFKPFMKYLFLLLLTTRPSWRSKYMNWIVEQWHEDKSPIKHIAEECIRPCIDVVSARSIVHAVSESAKINSTNLVSVMSKSSNSCIFNRTKTSDFHDIDRLEGFGLKRADFADVDVEIFDSIERYPDKWINCITQHHASSDLVSLRVAVKNCIFLINEDLQETLRLRRIHLIKKAGGVLAMIRFPRLIKKKIEEVKHQEEVKKSEVLMKDVQPKAKRHMDFQVSKSRDRSTSISKDSKVPQQSIVSRHLKHRLDSPDELVAKKSGDSALSRSRDTIKSRKLIFSSQELYSPEGKPNQLFKHNQKMIKEIHLPVVGSLSPDSRVASFIYPIPSAGETNLQIANQNGTNPAVSKPKTSFFQVLKNPGYSRTRVDCTTSLDRFRGGFKSGWQKYDGQYLRVLKGWIRDKLSWRVTAQWQQIITSSKQTEERKSLETEREIFSDKQLIKGLIQVSY